ncbi:MAG: hypothetical protein MRY63_14040 [Neomegalonema sp.]|nr:hypothetical protein [Neomegalonema sp.]
MLEDQADTAGPAASASQEAADKAGGKADFKGAFLILRMAPDMARCDQLCRLARPLCEDGPGPVVFPADPPRMPGAADIRERALRDWSERHLTALRGLDEASVALRRWYGLAAPDYFDFLREILCLSEQLRRTVLASGCSGFAFSHASGEQSARSAVLRRLIRALCPHAVEWQLIEQSGGLSLIQPQETALDWPPPPQIDVGRVVQVPDNLARLSREQARLQRLSRLRRLDQQMSALCAGARTRRVLFLLPEGRHLAWQQDRVLGGRALHHGALAGLIEAAIERCNAQNAQLILAGHALPPEMARDKDNYSARFPGAVHVLDLLELGVEGRAQSDAVRQQAGLWVDAALHSPAMAQAMRLDEVDLAPVLRPILRRALLRAAHVWAEQMPLLDDLLAHLRPVSVIGLGLETHPVAGFAAFRRKIPTHSWQAPLFADPGGERALLSRPAEQLPQRVVLASPQERDALVRLRPALAGRLSTRIGGAALAALAPPLVAAQARTLPLPDQRPSLLYGCAYQCLDLDWPGPDAPTQLWRGAQMAHADWESGFLIAKALAAEHGLALLVVPGMQEDRAALLGKVIELEGRWRAAHTGAGEALAGEAGAGKDGGGTQSAGFEPPAQVLGEADVGAALWARAALLIASSEPLITQALAASCPVLRYRPESWPVSFLRTSVLDQLIAPVTDAPSLRREASALLSEPQRYREALRAQQARISMPENISAPSRHWLSQEVHFCAQAITA